MAEKEPEKQPKPDAKPPKKEEVDNAPLPFLVEFTFTSAVILLSLVFFVVSGILLFTGATVLDFILRVGGATLILGVLLVLIVRQISMGALRARRGMGKQMPPQVDTPQENEIRVPFKVE